MFVFIIDVHRYHQLPSAMRRPVAKRGCFRKVWCLSIEEYLFDGKTFHTIPSSRVSEGVSDALFSSLSSSPRHVGGIRK